MKKDTKRPLKILSVPVDRGGCGWLRVRQPFFMVDQTTDTSAHVIDKEGDNPIAISEALCQADILVVRQGGEMGVPLLRRAADDYAKEMGYEEGFHAKIVLDIDDNIELISPYSQHYEEYGVREFEHQGKKIWENGRGNFNLVNNRARILRLMLGLRQADLITVTTEKLAEYARLFNPNVAILPNCIDMKRWWKPNYVRPHKQLRVGWSGGISHYEDWYAIKEPLNALMRKYQFKVVMEGAAFTGIFDDDVKQLVEVHEWAPFEGYSYHMMVLDLDFTIVPLADLPFNHYKSSIKYIEFSAMGSPSVVSNILPYSATITPERALGYRSNEEFYEQMERMIQDASLRDRIATNAEKFVRANFDAKKNAHLWVDAYRELL